MLTEKRTQADGFSRGSSEPTAVLLHPDITMNTCRKHMQGYVDELAFRLNEGNVKEATLGRIGALLGKSVAVRLTYTELIGR